MSDETQVTVQSARAVLPRIVALLRQIGPYAAIELILPGGSLIALLLWFCRRHAIPRLRMRLGASLGARSFSHIHTLPIRHA